MFYLDQERFGCREENPLKSVRTKRRLYWKDAKDLWDWKGSHTSRGTQLEARKSEPKMFLTLSVWGQVFSPFCFPLHVSISFCGPVFSPLVNTRPYKPQLWSDLSAHKPKIEWSLQVPTEIWLLQQSHRWALWGQTSLWFNQFCPRDRWDQTVQTGLPASRLWVREAFLRKGPGKTPKGFYYKKQQQKAKPGFLFPFVKIICAKDNILFCTICY